MDPERTQFGVLGPLVAWRETKAGWTELDVGPPRQRAVLAALVLRPGRVLDAADLITAVWGDAPPRGGANVIQTYISALRRILEPDRAPRSSSNLLVSTKQGYCLAIEPCSVDAHLAEFRLERARTQWDVDALSKILALWRGTPLAGLPGPFASTQRTRLTELRAAVLEEYFEACLAASPRGNEIVGDLAALVEQHPLRERLRALLMRALDRDGRRTDALAVFRQGRKLLVDRQGVEPGAELQRLHHTILAAETDPSVPRQLPAPVYAFTGRQDELSELNRLLRQGPTVPITAVVGPAGVGKTSLVVQWCHDNIDRFPDGQLFVDLRGFGHDTTRNPHSVLTALLTALGVPPVRVPTEPDDATVLLRTMLADRRIVLILDNARTPDDVRPLLPGNPSVAVIVTSRDDMTGLLAQEGARRVQVEPLRHDESEQLLHKLLGHANRELAELCGHLPLALRIAAANVAPLGPSAVEGYLERLRTPERLEALQVLGDDQLATLSTFRASYQALPPEAADVFGLLGIPPGEHSGPPAMAALTGLDAAETERVLRILVGRHLVNQRSDGRYALHDLLRDFANRLPDSEHRLTALKRCLDYYLHSTAAALDFFSPGWIELPSPDNQVMPEQFDSESAALAWFDTESSNLVDAVSTASAAGLHHYTWQLARAPVTLFQMRGHCHNWIHTHQIALDSARCLDDPYIEAITINSLAYAYIELNRPEIALTWYEEAVERAREDPRVQAAASEGVARAQRGLNNTTASMRAAKRALTLYRELNDQLGACNALSQIALAHREHGNYARSLEYWDMCLEIRRRTRFKLGEGSTLAEVGETHRQFGYSAQAREHLIQAMNLLREVGHRQNLASALRDLGQVLRDQNEHDGARTHWQEAIQIYEEADNATAAAHVRTLLDSITDISH